MKGRLGSVLFVLAMLLIASSLATAQKKQGFMTCNDTWNDDRMAGHCDIREQTLPAGGPIGVDAGMNGGVSIKGWERAEIMVRSKVQTQAPTQAEADQLATEVRVTNTAANIHAEGPRGLEDRHWSVSYEVFVPTRSDLSLKAHNGGISISNVQGKLDFNTMNGGVNLTGVAGEVRGSTTNGGVNVELSGVRWEGGALDVTTTNGGVKIVLPQNYSAHLETGTVNGSVSTDFQLNVPLTERGRLPKDISVDIGSGGPLVRAVTTNGGIRVTHSATN